MPRHRRISQARYRRPSYPRSPRRRTAHAYYCNRHVPLHSYYGDRRVSLRKRLKVFRYEIAAYLCLIAVLVVILQSLSL